MYGVPLKIRPPTLDFEDQERVENLPQQREQLQQELETAEEDEQNEFKERIKSLTQQVELLLQTNLRASVDSELALVLTEDYPLEDWLFNPFFLGFRKQELFLKRNDVLIVGRLDGPTADTVRRVIDDSVAVERTGLQGTAYFDARWKKPENKKTKAAMLSTMLPSIMLRKNSRIVASFLLSSMTAPSSSKKGPVPMQRFAVAGTVWPTTSMPSPGYQVQ
jgi:uncharacterized protein (TIGR03790 family)